MKKSVTKIFEFAAAHNLPHHQGLCKHFHGHNYKLEVSVSGEVTTPEGMIIDFSDLKHLIKTHIIDEYDHSNLNDHFENPTAEIMVEHIYHKLVHVFDGALKVVKVRLWETSTSYAEVEMEVK